MSARLAVLAVASMASLIAPAQADPWPSRGGVVYGGYERQWRDDRETVEHRLDRTAAEIREGMGEGWLRPWEARWAWGELRAIRAQAGREFRFHGAVLPDDDRREINERIERLNFRLHRMERRG